MKSGKDLQGSEQWAFHPTIGDFIREMRFGHRETQRGGGPVRTEAETGVRWPQAEEHLWPPAAQRDPE